MTAFRRLKAPCSEPALADEDTGLLGVWEGIGQISCEEGCP